MCQDRFQHLKDVSFGPETADGTRSVPATLPKIAAFAAEMWGSKISRPDPFGQLLLPLIHQRPVDCARPKVSHV